MNRGASRKQIPISFAGIPELQKLAAVLPLLMNKLAQQFVFQNMSRPLSFDAPPPRWIRSFAA